MTLYLVRHAKAGDRNAWNDDDRLRPLSGRGQRQAHRLVDAARRREVRPDPVEPVRALHADRRADRRRARLPVEPVDALAGAGQPDEGLASLRKHALGGALMCIHGDVMPMLLEHFDAAGVDIADELRWPKGCTWVLDTDDTGEVVRAALSPAAVRVTGTPGAPVDSFAPVERIHRARRDRPSGPRLHAQGPGRQRRDVVVVPRAAERRGRVLPVHLHRRVPGRAVLAARRPLASSRRRRRRCSRSRATPGTRRSSGPSTGLQLPGALRLLAARRGGEGLRRLQRAARLREPRDVRDRRRRQGGRHVRVAQPRHAETREAYEAALAKLS